MRRSIEVILMAAAIGLLSVTAATAEGIQEQRDGNAAPQRGNQYYADEVVSVTGPVEFTASGAELKASDGKEYQLMYPRFAADDIEIEPGDTVSVEGFLVPGPRWEDADNEQHLMLTRVTIDGEEYDLTRRFGPGSRGGTFGGRMCCDDGSYGYSPRSRSGSPGGPDQFRGPGPYDRNGYDRGSANPGPGMRDPRGPGMQGSRSYRW